MWGAMRGTRARDRFMLRRHAELRGRRSELWAAFLLSCKLYRVLGWRVKTPLGELDLVALSPDGVLCFIEVKARAEEGSAAEAITARQRSRIERAAALYPDLARKDAQTLAYRTLPLDELFDVQPVAIELDEFDAPGKPLIRVTCVACKEEVNDFRHVTGDDGPLCRACAGQPYYKTLQPVEDDWSW